MSTQAVALKRSITGKMVLRAMRNLIVGTIVFLIVGNLLIFTAFQVISRVSGTGEMPTLPSIENLTAVDATVWRGSAPDRSGYAALSEHGVTTIVDLRAEDLAVDEPYLNSLGMQLVRIPMRDGQTPTPGQVDTFLAAVKNSTGLVYLHCGAGVGRTGTMAAAYLVNSGQASPLTALSRNLAVGPPSLEQIAFAASVERGEATHSNIFITAVSRVLDSPRRLLVNLRNSYGD